VFDGMGSLAQLRQLTSLKVGPGSRKLGRMITGPGRCLNGVAMGV
jgi:hypothetical protein